MQTPHAVRRAEESMRSIWDRVVSEFARLSRLFEPLGRSCAVLFTVGLVAKGLDWPDGGWDRGEPLPVVLITTGAITAVHQTYVTLDRGRRKRRALLDNACLQIADHIDEAMPSVPLRSVGAHIWIVKGLFRPRLTRAGTFLIRQRAESNVVWARGKGVVGAAWEQRAPVIVDLEADLYSRVHSAEDLSRLPQNERLGLEWDEVRRTNQYKAIFATPLFGRNGRDVRGVAVIDILEDGHYDELLAATQGNRDFNAIIGICQDAIRS